MALQGEPRTSSSIAGLPIYWQEATKPPELEWENGWNYSKSHLWPKATSR